MHHCCHTACVLLRSMAGALLPTVEQEPLADQYVGGLAGNRRFYNMANNGQIQPIIGTAPPLRLAEVPYLLASTTRTLLCVQNSSVVAGSQCDSYCFSSCQHLPC
jgi:hypothetical protein